MTAAPVIALDGPGGVGKGTVGRAVAKRLGWHYLDSGALYRVAALAALRADLDAAQTERIAALVPQLVIECRGERVLLDGEDVSRAIRDEATSRMASAIAAAPIVRQALTGRQRAFRQAPGLVADGRDMGTVVFPDAALKVFLAASPGERALRRHKQLKQQGINVTLPRLERELRARDARDAERKTAPLKAAADAMTLDTTAHSAEWVVGKVLEFARASRVVKLD
ncbi:MAG: (d)CMP kinase [Gammaproteobacteria bacterium]